ncbi:hypothetical protein AGMMS49992_20870 [Clostridia bacterium]|nr:hypothetical protein AGMMS49992_20870 [Clostridia bacterium]
MKEILIYMNNPKAFPIDQTDNELIKKIDRSVKLNKHDPKWRQQYMFSMQNRLTAELIGERRGIEKGQKEYALKLLKKLTADAVADLLELPLSQVMAWQQEARSLSN